MCGICGIFNSEKNINREQLVKMNDMLYHRGPDDSGVYLNTSLGMAMRRLSIIDLTKGKQPIFSEDKSIAIVLNGEIYNFKELTDYLKNRGHRFLTNSDTECIVHLYEEYKEECVRYLNGMFAFAIWDDKEKRLLLARDHLGIKPLYYSLKGNKLFFASEIKALLANPEINREIDNIALDNFLELRYIPGPRTIFKDIKKLGPGCRLIRKNKVTKIQRYWQIPNSDCLNLSEEYYTKKLSSLLASSVRMQLMSDVPLGAFLSGGIDSSIIVGLMSKLSHRPIDTFSVSFGTRDYYDEIEFAKITAKHFGANHHEIVVNPETIKVLPQLIKQLDEPLADPAILPTYYLSKVTKDFVTVALSGEGADELFGGYDKYKLNKLILFYKKFPKGIQRALQERFANSTNPKIRSFVHLAMLSDYKRSLAWDGVFSEEEKMKLYACSFREKVLQERNQEEALFCWDENYGNDFDKMNRFDLNVWLPDDLLMKVDKMSMAVSLETRVPYLDYRVVEFAMQIPANLKVKNMVEKYILRKTFSNMLPPTVLRRKKHGFSVPVNDWIKNELKDFTKEILTSPHIAKDGLFDKDYILGLLRSHFENKRSCGKQLWSLLNLELWYRIYIKNENF